MIKIYGCRIFDNTVAKSYKGEITHTENKCTLTHTHTPTPIYVHIHIHTSSRKLQKTLEMFCKRALAVPTFLSLRPPNRIKT